MLAIIGIEPSSASIGSSSQSHVLCHQQTWQLCNMYTDAVWGMRYMPVTKCHVNNHVLSGRSSMSSSKPYIQRSDLTSHGVPTFLFVGAYWAFPSTTYMSLFVCHLSTRSWCYEHQTLLIMQHCTMSSCCITCSPVCKPMESSNGCHTTMKYSILTPGHATNTRHSTRVNKTKSCQGPGHKLGEVNVKSKQC